MRTYLQFSIDDTLDILKELTEKRPASLFEIERFRFFQELREKYGVIVSFYAFFTDGSFTLADVTAAYREEFQENADWLKFGVHSTDKTTSFADADGLPEYERILGELTRIAGKESLDLCFRPHFFKIAPDLLKTLRAKSLCLGVHCPDDARKCHPFTGEEESILQREGYLKKEGILYLKTQTRLEGLTEESTPEFLTSLEGKKFLSVFTHESFLTNLEILGRIEELCRFAAQKGFRFAFPADIL